MRSSIFKVMVCTINSFFSVIFYETNTILEQSPDRLQYQIRIHFTLTYPNYHNFNTGKKNLEIGDFGESSENSVS
jgi:hypothetical protein